MNRPIHDYLRDILTAKQQEVVALQESIRRDPQQTIAQLLRGDIKRTSVKSLKQALLAKRLAVIAEIKRRSPSKAHLAAIMDPAALALEYAAGGAAAISVLTDQYGFGGSLQDLQQVATALQATPLPILRKDFTLDRIQLAEAIAYGADAVLLIVAVLGEQTATLLEAARELNIEALVEVHTQAELEHAIAIGADIIGINHRNLSTFDVDVNSSAALLPLIPTNTVTVAESGIDSPAVGRHLGTLGFNALLIGEALVKSQTPALFIQALND